MKSKLSPAIEPVQEIANTGDADNSSAKLLIFVLVQLQSESTLAYSPMNILSQATLQYRAIRDGSTFTILFISFPTPKIALRKTKCIQLKPDELFHFMQQPE